MVKKCLECEGPLEKKKFTDAWKDETPSEVNEDYYCAFCGIRWVGLEREPDKEGEP